MRRSLYFVIVSCYLGGILAQGLQGAIRSYRFVYGNDAGSGIFQPLQSASRQLTAMPLFEVLASYAGTRTGYGFFAPQVGSSYRLEVSALDSAGNVVAHTGSPLFSHPHSRLRYQSLLHRLQDIPPGRGAEANPWAARHARALAHCMAQRLAKWRWGTRYTRLRCTVSVYRHTALRASEAGVEPRRYIIYEHIIPHRYQS